MFGRKELYFLSNVLTILYEEVDKMVHNLERTLDNIKNEGIRTGEKNKAIEIALKMLKEELDINMIVNITGLNEKEVLSLKKKINKQRH